MRVSVLNYSGKPLRLRLSDAPSFMTVTILSSPDKASPSLQVHLCAPKGTKQKEVLGGKLVFETGLELQPFLEVPFFAAVKEEIGF